MSGIEFYKEVICMFADADSAEELKDAYNFIIDHVDDMNLKTCEYRKLEKIYMKLINAINK